MDCSQPGFAVHGIFPSNITRVVLPFPSPGDLPNLGMESASHVSSAMAGRLFTTAPRGKRQVAEMIQTARERKTEDRRGSKYSLRKVFILEKLWSIEAKIILF